MSYSFSVGTDAAERFAKLQAQNRARATERMVNHQTGGTMEEATAVSAIKRNRDDEVSEKGELNGRALVSHSAEEVGEAADAKPLTAEDWFKQACEHHLDPKINRDSAGVFTYSKEIPSVGTVETKFKSFKSHTESKNNKKFYSRLYSKFVCTVTLSPFLQTSPPGEAAVKYLMLYKEEHLCKFSTMMNYCDQLANQLSTNVERFNAKDRRELKDYSIYCKTHSLHEQTEHAATITDDYVKEVITALKEDEKDKQLLLHVWLYCVTSGRHADIVNMFGLQHKDGNLLVDWGERKNAKEQILLSSESYPLEWFEPFGINVQEVPLPLLKNAQKSDLERLNAWLKSTAAPTYTAPQVEDPEAGQARRIARPDAMPTSYSFRRWAIQKIIHRCTDPETGKVDWKRVIKYTGHANNLMPQNIYDQTLLQQFGREKAAADKEEAEKADIEESEEDAARLQPVPTATTGAERTAKAPTASATFKSAKKVVIHTTTPIIPPANPLRAAKKQ